MNSAYIYIPYISSARSYTNRQRIVTQDTIIKYRKGVKIEKVEYDTSEIVNKYSVEINGGIIWYRLNIDENGKTKINMIKNITASSSSQYNPTDYNSEKNIGDFILEMILGERLLNNTYRMMQCSLFVKN